MSPVTLSDMLESPHLNHQCELIARKICNPVAPAAGTSLDAALGLAAAARSLVLHAQKTENTGILERAEDKSTDSLV